MEKIHKIALGVMIIGIILSAVFSPVMSIIAGMGLWILLWVAQGGAAEGNPYKRMAYSGSAPDFIEVKQFKRKMDIETKDRARYSTTVFVFGVGLILVLVGIIWVNIVGF